MDSILLHGRTRTIFDTSPEASLGSDRGTSQNPLPARESAHCALGFAWLAWDALADCKTLNQKSEQFQTVYS